MLLKMQMQRMMTRPNAKIFEGIGAAEAWLFEQSGY
jgi:hypothetical protein